MSDPLAVIARLPGVEEAVEEARRAVDRLYRHRVLRRASPAVSAESSLRGARASAALAGVNIPLDLLRTDFSGDPVVQGALRASVEVGRLGPTWRRAPRQVLARLHTVAAAGLTAEPSLGRPRSTSPSPPSALPAPSALSAAAPPTPSALPAPAPSNLPGPSTPSPQSDPSDSPALRAPSGPSDPSDLRAPSTPSSQSNPSNLRGPSDLRGPSAPPDPSGLRRSYGRYDLSDPSALQGPSDPQGPSGRSRTSDLSGPSDPREPSDLQGPSEFLELGPMPSAEEATARMDGVFSLLATPTKAPALVLAAIVHAELAVVRPFGTADGVVARAAERLTLVEFGLDPKSLAAVEVGHLELPYLDGLRAYLTGTQEGVAQWVQQCASAVTLGVRETTAICEALQRG